MGVRLLWGVTTPYLIRLVDRRPVQRTRRVGFRQRFPLSWAGFRGAVSLAAALALPQETASGEPLPGRDLVIAVTFVVILFTLVVQGLTLPAVVRWSGLTRDPREFDEELLGEQAMLRAAIDELPVVGRSLGTSEPVIEGLRASYEDRLQLIHREEGIQRRRGARAASVTRRTRSTSRSSPRSAPPCSPSGTSAASTTSSCGVSRPGSTSRNSACPRRPTTTERRTPPTAGVGGVREWRRGRGGISTSPAS